MSGSEAAERDGAAEYQGGQIQRAVWQKDRHRSPVQKASLPQRYHSAAESLNVVYGVIRQRVPNKKSTGTRNRKGNDASAGEGLEPKPVGRPVDLAFVWTFA
jgi:hypothetical protein